MNDVEHILPNRNLLGESPVWSEEEEAFYWVDIRNNSYSRLDPTSGQYKTVNVGVAIGVLAMRAVGGLVMATQKGFALWNPRTKELKYIAQPFGEDPTMRFNDGAVDSYGRFWAGSMCDDESANRAAGVLYRLDPDGSVHTMETGIIVPNGIGWSPDNTRMYFTDSALKIIYVYTFDAVTGQNTDRRIFADSSKEEGNPDGLAVDSEGYVWSARWNGAKIIRYAPDGNVERELKMPILRPTSCTFGGKDLTELYITSAAVDEQNKAQYPLSGDLFRLKTGIKGLPKYQFAG